MDERNWKGQRSSISRLTSWKNGTKIETGVYRKPTHTLRYSNYRSNRPKDCQLNIIKGLLFRAYNTCDAGSRNREAELSLISDVFIACEYPVQQVDSLIQNYTSLRFQMVCSDNSIRKVWMLFFFKEEQLDNGSATTSQKEFPKDGNRRYTKFPVNVANFILVKQVFGLTKERTNTNMQSKNVTSAIVLLHTSLKQVTQLNGMILLLLMDTNTKKTEKSKNLCTSMLFPTVGIQLDNYLT